MKRPTNKTHYGYKTLSGTSQGRVFDLPPEHWIEEELLKFDAKRANLTVKPPALSEKLHSVFAYDRWQEVEPQRWQALTQSMMLATNLIRLSGPAFACFFPRFKQNRKRSVCASAVPDDETRSRPDPSTAREWSNALHMFERLAVESIIWREDPTMLKNEDWLGINMPYNTTPPFHPKSQYEWGGADEDADVEGLLLEDSNAAGHDSSYPPPPQRRPITVGISTIFVDTILAHPPGSQKHLVATFYCGVTLMHELAHWCATHCIRDEDPSLGEPYFGDSVEMELGNAWISWLFCTKLRPDFIIPAGASPHQDLFTHGLCWLPTLNCLDTRPVYETRYAMRLTFIERLMSNDTWADQDLEHFTAPDRRALLAPPISQFREGSVARIATLYRLPHYADMDGFAKHGQPNHFDWTHAPFQYVDLLLSEKVRGGHNRSSHHTESPALPEEMQQLIKRLKYVRDQERKGEGVDNRKELRRNDYVAIPIAGGYEDEDELPGVFASTPPPQKSGLAVAIDEEENEYDDRPAFMRMFPGTRSPHKATPITAVLKRLSKGRVGDGTKSSPIEIDASVGRPIQGTSVARKPSPGVIKKKTSFTREAGAVEESTESVGVRKKSLAAHRRRPSAGVVKQRSPRKAQQGGAGAGKKRRASSVAWEARWGKKNVL